MWSSFPLPTAILVGLGMLSFARAIYDSLRESGILT